MAKLLDSRKAIEIRDGLLDALDELGYDPEESIPGLVATLYAIADLTPLPEQALDEAADLLADGDE